MNLKMIITGIVILLIISILVFLQSEIFGQTPTGKRLERIQKSPQYRDGKFQNEHLTPDLVEGISYWDILKAYFKKVENKEPDFVLPSVRSDLKNMSATEPKIVWFGHSSYLLFINGKTVLVDPVFSGYASPVPIFIKNFECSNVYGVNDMPDVIDVLLITHDHYDHLDHKTVKALEPRVRQVVTSLGVGSHLERWGYVSNKINELDWTESVLIDSLLSFTAAPARHFSGRGLKRNQTLWSSFVLKTPTHNLYLGGDSGYDTHFKAIGQNYGPFDLAILECGQYNYFWKYIHMVPEEVVQAAQDLNAKVLLPVHWGKFTLALHPWNEPIERVIKEAERLKQPIMTPIIGELVNPKSDRGEVWWR